MFTRRSCSNCQPQKFKNKANNPTKTSRQNVKTKMKEKKEKTGEQEEEENKEEKAQKIFF